MAGRYYGLDRQYFTTMIDYGFSKRLEETLVKWGRENVLRDVVRMIRMDRPFVLIARFQGNARDGHGNHEAAGHHHAGGVPRRRRSGGVSRADPRRPAAVAAAEALHGRRPRERGLDAADRHRRVQPVARRLVPDLRAPRPRVPAIAERRPRQRAGGSVDRVLQAAGGDGPAKAGHYRNRSRPDVGSVRLSRTEENSFFDGIDTSIPGLFSAIRRPAPPAAAALLSAIDVEVRAAVAAFSMQNPSASVPALARGLAATRTAISALARGARCRVHPADERAAVHGCDQRRARRSTSRRSPRCRPGRARPARRRRRVADQPRVRPDRRHRDDAARGGRRTGLAAAVERRRPMPADRERDRAAHLRASRCPTTRR